MALSVMTLGGRVGSREAATFQGSAAAGSRSKLSTYPAPNWQDRWCFPPLPEAQGLLSQALRVGTGLEEGKYGVELAPVVDIGPKDWTGLRDRKMRPYRREGRPR